jgi:hypothetical protein
MKNVPADASSRIELKTEVQESVNLNELSSTSLPHQKLDPSNFEIQDFSYRTKTPPKWYRGFSSM